MEWKKTTQEILLTEIEEIKKDIEESYLVSAVSRIEELKETIEYILGIQ